MVIKLIPEFDKVYFINKYTILHILEGNGNIQVDFKNYPDWSDKIIFLEKGQYIKFLSNDFIVRKIELEDEQLFRNKDVRILFKHLVSLGYINFKECEDCQKYLEENIIFKPIDFIDISSQQWHWQNPFGANKEEYQVIFDVKDIIDLEYKNHLTNEDLSILIGHSDLKPHTLFSNKIGITIKGVLGEKRLTESKKMIAFTEKSMKEIAYEFGYKDPAYFNRVFKSSTGLTPNEFRENFVLEKEDNFILNLFELLQKFHTKQRQTDFYANKMNMSVKTLSKKVKDKLQISLGQLIRQELLHSAKKMLSQGFSISETSYILGFEEANHFSAFFKHYTNLSPSMFQDKKCN